MLRVRRHLRRQERRDLDRDADRQAPLDPRQRRRGLRRGRQLVPAPYSGRAVALARRRAHDARRRDLGGARMSPGAGFPTAASAALRDTQLRANLRRATTTIRERRARAVAEVEDWEALRTEGARIKDAALRELDSHLETLEAAVTRQGGTVHWA